HHLYRDGHGDVPDGAVDANLDFHDDSQEVKERFSDASQKRWRLLRSVAQRKTVKCWPQWPQLPETPLMMHVRSRMLLLLALFILLPVSAARSADEDERVRKAFIALQTALKGPDAEQVWKLLDADTRKAAERAAKAVQAAYSKANADDRAKLE